MTYVSPAGEFTCVEYQGQRGYVLTSYIARSGGAPAVNPATGDRPTRRKRRRPDRYGEGMAGEAYVRQ